jgi:hypothetical protein
VTIGLQGGESKTFRINKRTSAGIKEVQDFVFGGDFERAQADAVAIPSILATFFLVTILAAGLFLIWSVRQLWDRIREISDSARVRESLGSHKIIGSLDADAQRNIGNRLGPDREVQSILGEVDEHQQTKAQRTEDNQRRHNNREKEG